MKFLVRLILFFAIISTLTATGQGIIIDHNCTGIDQIPVNIISDVKDNLKWEYGSLSHGNQLLCGILQVENENSIYNVEIGGEYYCCEKNIYSPPYLPNVPDALCIYSGVNGMRNLGWASSFTYHVQTTLNQNPDLNVFQFCWCGEMDTWTSGELQEYFVVMQNLSVANPNVTFVYMTGNAQSSGEYGYNRHMRNQEIRQYCIQNNKVLFDFADLDSWYNGEQATYLYNGQHIPVQHSAYNGEICHHTNELNCYYKGKAVWWMMARLSGWNPVSRSLNLHAYLQGSYATSVMNTSLNSLGLLPLNQPFNFPPINYNGNESVPAIPNANVVDWIFLELRDAPNAQLATSSTVIERKAAFILNNGQIVDLDGASLIPISQTINQQLFVVLRHRNHLAIMSSAPLTATNDIYTYNFTTGSGKAYGGIDSQKQLITGVWGMITGDGNLDGVVNNSDKTSSWIPFTGKKGYNRGDFNLNGNTNNQDKNLFLIGNLGRISFVP